ncbi:MAG: GGDEF domain-containing protein [Burkholderiales bacterium]|nr:GGDEF domain-containing protein [Burkholderiales bacterium]
MSTPADSPTDDIEQQVRHLVGAGRIDEALALASEGARGAQGQARAQALRALAWAALSAGRFTDCLRAAISAEALCREAHDAVGADDALVLCAGALRAAGDHAAALEMLERVEVPARAQGDPLRLLRVLRQIGVAASLLGRHQHAMSCLGEAAALGAGRALGEETLSLRLSWLNARNRHAESLSPDDPARQATHTALLDDWQALAADCRAQGAARLQAMAEGNHAITLHLVGRDEEAAAALRALLPVYERLGMAPNAGLCLTEEARCLAALGRLAEAAQRHEQALQVLETHGTLEDRCAALEGLADAREQLGDAAGALAALKRLRTLERQSTAERAQAAVRQRELRLELARLTHQWAREATEDPLTGLGNRRALQAWLHDHLPDEQGHGDGLALVLVDLDHFKQVNDRHGHGVGDEVLRRVGRLLAANCRARDRAVRYGGEEFVLGLAGADRQAAAEVAERLRQAIAAQPWPEVSPGLHVTASLGVADAREAAGAQALLTLADQRLYAAKLGGRDRVVAGEPMPAEVAQAG